LLWLVKKSELPVYGYFICLCVIMALGKYEVVVLIDATNPADKIEEIKKSVENLISEFGGKVLDRDDIGYLETLYEIGSSNNPYFYSLYTELE